MASRRPAPGGSGDLFGGAEPCHSLFFALLPPAPVQTELVQARSTLEAGLPAQRGNPVPVQRLHLTLAWLGEWASLPPASVAAAQQAAATLQVPAFVLGLDLADCFGHGETVWVLRPSSPPAGVLALQRALCTALLRHGQRQAGGTSFSPHVSLRRRASERFEARPAGPVHWPVERFALIHSERGDAGVQYRVLGEWPLQRLADQY